MNVHSPLGVMHVADLAVGTASNRAAALGHVRIASLGRETSGRRVAEAGAGTSKQFVPAARYAVLLTVWRAAHSYQITGDRLRFHYLATVPIFLGHSSDSPRCVIHPKAYLFKSHDVDEVCWNSARGTAR